MNDSVLVFGELLMRLDTPEHQRFVQAERFEISFTGGEANVAVALAQWGASCQLLSAVPQHALGESCLNHFRRYGVETGQVRRSGERLGLLYVETGAGQRGTQVVYDRCATSFRELKPGDLNWDELLSSAGWLHFTGTALVSPGTRALLLEGLTLARQRHIPVSFDVSYRSKLWDLDTARAAFLEVMPFVSLLFGSEQDAHTFFGMSETGAALFPALIQKYPQLKWVAFSERELDDLGNNRYAGTLSDGTSTARSSSYPTVAVDRIGTGDAFAAGVIHQLRHAQTLNAAVNFATAAAVLKHTIPRDLALLSVAEIEQFLAGNAVGKVSR